MFCAQCGAAATPGMGFCPRCGQTYSAPVTTGPTLSPDAQMAPSAPRGKVVAPWKVVLFPLLTLGVYTYWMWWRTSRETDTHLGSRSHALTRMGIALALAALIVSVWVAMKVILPLIAAVVAEPTLDVDREAMVDAYAKDPMFLAAQGGIAIGLLVMYAGLWRAWQALRQEEQRRGRADALDPRIYAAILGGAAILAPAAIAVPALSIGSFVAALATFWVFYDWQSRLNATWKAPAGAAPAPTLEAW